MMTVTEFAHGFGLSRGTILYYERVGLLKPARRSGANYRRYGTEDVERLGQICLYRKAGLKVSDIRALLDRPDRDSGTVLERRLAELDREIETLRGHQRVIVRLLQDKDLEKGNENMTKEKWVEIMRSTGFTDDDMRRWHVHFERSAPDDHQQFLEFLHIPAEEIRKIREWSQKG